jgi:roadblock/LC7 domain-containing protein
VLPPRGWVVRGPHFTVCNMANVFCFLDNSKSSINDVMALMNRHLGDASHELI